MGFRIDASIVCFFAVVGLAVPVAMLRSQTYAIGYDLAQLKQEERMLRQSNIELESELAAQERTVRDKYVPRPVFTKKGDNPKKTPQPSLQLPETYHVISGGSHEDTSP